MLGQSVCSDSLCRILCCRCNDVTMEFKAVSMARSVKGAEDPAFASRETFKARGVEHAFALNGHK